MLEAKEHYLLHVNNCSSHKEHERSSTRRPSFIKRAAENMKEVSNIPVVSEITDNTNQIAE